MELLFEFILDLIFEGSEALGSGARIPAAIRITALVVFSLISLAVTGIVVLVTVILAVYKLYLLAALMGALAIAFTVLTIKKIVHFIHRLS